LTAFSPSGIPVAELFFLCPLLIPSETVFLYLIQPITKKKEEKDCKTDYSWKTNSSKSSICNIIVITFIVPHIHIRKYQIAEVHYESSFIYLHFISKR